MNDLARLRELLHGREGIWSGSPQQWEAESRELIDALPALLTELEHLCSAVSDAETVINRGVELMTYKQVGRWTGVRHWLETYALDAAKDGK